MFADLIAPRTCVSCGAPQDDLCRSCAERVIVLEPSFLGRGESFDSARSLVAFTEPARSLTLRLKRHGSRSIAEAIGSLLAAFAQREGLPTDAVTWVPAGAEKAFDHAELVGRAAARQLGLPAQRLLRRVAKGPRQADVPLEARSSNVRDRFAARSSPARVLLIDDVFTTGATAEACARALKGAGAARVEVITWARTMLRQARGRR